MPGIYIHIPFCKQACHYCNFHFSTSFKKKPELLEALLQEIDLRKDYLAHKTIETIYFGGGTPSLLSSDEINRIIDRLSQIYNILPTAEITLEANPDDLDHRKLTVLKHTPINRLSIGIQSFFDEDLKFMNRSHNATQSLNCVAEAQQMGFTNLSIDLIYGSPTTSDIQWQSNLELFLERNIPHLSSYCLTVEPGTALAHFVKTGKVTDVEEEKASKQFSYLIQTLKKAGYLHYEISNFAQEGFIAQHNTNYWLGKEYLGVGPSAHSFDRKSRQWNISNNIRYIAALADDKIPFEKEMLSLSDQYNEYILTNLRTMWGCNCQTIKTLGNSFYEHFIMAVKPFLINKTIAKKGETYKLTDKGKLLADNISMELFLDK